jgi:dTDP-4-dehydrorhamnose reductase
MLGRDLTGLLARNHQVAGVDVGDFDITDRQATADALAAAVPEVVIHCAAYTDVEKAETDCDRVYAVNAAGSENIARACREIGARLYLVSTDFVFDGAKDAPYVESDIPNPLCQYGRSKFEGETRAARVLGSKLSVVRAAWLYGAAGESFLTKLVRLARDREVLKVVDDQRGSPTWTMELAACLARLVESGAGRPVYHASCAGECSRYELAVEWFALLGIDSVRLEPVSSGEFPTSAERPANSALANENLEKDGIEPPAPWRQALARFADEGGREIAAKLMEG